MHWTCKTPLNTMLLHADVRKIRYWCTVNRLSKGGPNSGIFKIPFRSPLVNHYKDVPVLTCCIIVQCKISKIICYTVQLSDSGCKNKCYVMLWEMSSLCVFRHCGTYGFGLLCLWLVGLWSNRSAESWQYVLHEFDLTMSEQCGPTDHLLSYRFLLARHRPVSQSVLASSGNLCK